MEIVKDVAISKKEEVIVNHRLHTLSPKLKYKNSKGEEVKIVEGIAI